MTRLIFIRHADATDELGNQLDEYSLNNEGRVQALQLARRLKEAKFHAVYCSKITRSMETCKIVMEEHDNEVVYSSAFNEIGGEGWPSQTYPTTDAGTKGFHETVSTVSATYEKLVKRHPGEDVFVFTHGNWIRVLVSQLLSAGNPLAYSRLVILNTSLTIVEIRDDGFPYLISVSDSAHTMVYHSKI